MFMSLQLKYPLPTLWDSKALEHFVYAKHLRIWQK